MQDDDEINLTDDNIADYTYDYEANLKSVPVWKRLMYMLIFVVVFWVCRMLIFGIATLQFFSVLFTSETNMKLRDFGLSIGKYVAEIINFLTYNTEEKPFPFDHEWPS